MHAKMSTSNNSAENGATASHQKEYRGMRCRKWGKWVSEIRVPGTQESLWLGSYSTPEGAAIAHDVAFYCLRGPSSVELLNLPTMLPAGVRTDMSPRSVQKADSNAGMAVDARLVVRKKTESKMQENVGGGGVDGLEYEKFWVDDWCKCCETWERAEGSQNLSISVEDYL